MMNSKFAENERFAPAERTSLIPGYILLISSLLISNDLKILVDCFFSQRVFFFSSSLKTSVRETWFLCRLIHNTQNYSVGMSFLLWALSFRHAVEIRPFEQEKHKMRESMIITFFVTLENSGINTTFVLELLVFCLAHNSLAHWMDWACIAQNHYSVSRS